MEATAATDAATTCAVAFFDVDGTLVWRDFKQMEKQKTADVNSAEQIKPTPTTPSTGCASAATSPLSARAALCRL